jgi:hypothetical protein
MVVPLPPERLHLEFFSNYIYTRKYAVLTVSVKLFTQGFILKHRLGFHLLF